MNDVRSAQELLPWLLPLTDGLVACKDSSLLASFEFFGPDADTVGSGEIQQVGAAADRMMLSLRGLPVTLWWTVRRERTTDYPAEPMPDPVSQMLDDEHRANFLDSSAYINRHFLSVLWMPERSTASMLGKIGVAVGDGENAFSAIKTAISSTFFNHTKNGWSSGKECWRHWGWSGCAGKRFLGFCGQ